jgi:TfoX/Sxy family transcriptional regulator of competence genes
MYNEFLADRLRRLLKEKKITFSEKQMMGGLAFMVNDKMCVGINGDKLMARIHPDKYAEALEKKGAREMDFTGRPMRGWVFVEPEGIDTEHQLDHWVQLALDYNPLAKSSKNRK